MSTLAPEPVRYGSQTYCHVLPASSETTSPKVVPRKIRCGAPAGSSTLIPEGKAPSARAAVETRTASASAKQRMAGM